MIETQFNENLILLKMSGSVTDEDLDQVVLAFQDSLGPLFGVRLRHHSGAKFSVLMDWTELEEWKSGARAACTSFCMGYEDMVQRIAVVGRTAILRYKPANLQTTAVGMHEHGTRLFHDDRRLGVWIVGCPVARK